MGLKIQNNSNVALNTTIILIINTKSKTEANKLLKKYGIKIVSSSKEDDTKVIIIENI